MDEWTMAKGTEMHSNKDRSAEKHQEKKWGRKREPNFI